MRLLVLATLALCAVAAGANAQESNSVCRDGITIPQDLVLSICTNEHGMAPLPQPQLYLRIYADGSGEYEVVAPLPKDRSSAYPGLIKKNFQLTQKELQEIEILGQADDFQKAKDNYPIFRGWDDSSLETTVAFTEAAGTKTIVVNNFMPSEPDNLEHFPASFVKLMLRAQEIRDRLTGINRQ